ncbi:DUF4956 domain-containing protein [Flavobacterium sp.]|uniref:DUF4956 domain-containing protein n=1 Tax=Flavobacterium sp. TaxID=239 RepID=UPI003D2684D1
MENEEVVTSAFNIAAFSNRAIIDFISIIILVGLIYYPKHKNKDFIFNFVLFNVVNFMICSLLGAVKIKIGFAFGLFAMFSIIRYRTIAISIKDMGYFFGCVALGMINSLASVDDGYYLLIACNAVILILTFCLERLDFLKNENSKDIVYDNVELIKPDNKLLLLEDLKIRTGLNIHNVEVISIDYLKDVALIKAYYFSKESLNLIPTSKDSDD